VSSGICGETKVEKRLNGGGYEHAKSPQFGQAIRFNQAIFKTPFPYHSSPGDTKPFNNAKFSSFDIINNFMILRFAAVAESENHSAGPF
jgi:hypothetical protein